MSVSSTTQDFVRKAIARHGARYGYSDVSYVSSKVDVTLFCPTHGAFTIRPNNHLSGAGCRKCGYSRNSVAATLTRQLFIQKAVCQHGDRYNYGGVEYVDSVTNVDIGCKKHGVYQQQPASHLRGCGCPKCGIELTTTKSRSTNEQFVAKANRVHGGKYDYSDCEYGKSRTDVVTVKCPIHGSFQQVAYVHLEGCGCPKCGKSMQQSRPERQVIDLIRSSGFVVHESANIGGVEVDAYIPDLKLAFEVNGVYWHTEQFGKDSDYHANKTRQCASEGVRLVHLWGDDLEFHTELQYRFIRKLLGGEDDVVRYARKLTLSKISNQQATPFLTTHHNQGSANATLYVGLYDKTALVAVGLFTRRRLGYELVRYASDGVVVGGLGKVSKYVSGLVGVCVYTFCDLARYTGSSYLLAGYSLTAHIPPDYKYVVNAKRVHKSRFRRKNIAEKLPEVYSDKLTERQMMVSAKIFRIYDCGKARYEFQP